MVIPKINSAHGSDTRNILNRAIDLINAQGKSIQDLVAEGQLTPTQYATLLQSVNSLIARGEITAEDFNKNGKKLDATFFTSEFIAQLKDAAIDVTNVLPESIGTDELIEKSVLPNKTSFMKKTRNLFNGIYERGYVNIYQNTAYDVNGRAAVIPIKNNQTYTIKVDGPHNLFNISTSKKPPVFEGPNENPVSNVIIADANLSEYTFTNTFNNSYLIISVSSVNQEPKLMVNVGATALEYEQPFYLDSEYIPDIEDESIKPNMTTFFMKTTASKNIFDGNYLDGLLVMSTNPLQLLPRKDFTNVQGRIAEIKIKPNTTYSIFVDEKESNVFRIGAHHSKVIFPSGTFGESLNRPLFGNNAGDNDFKYTFTSNSDDNYLYVYVSNEGKNPVLIVNEGLIDNVKSDYIIPSLYLDLEDSGGLTKKNYSFNFFRDLNKLYRSPMIENYWSNPSTSTAKDYHNKLQALINSVPEAGNYANYSLKGTDEWGNEIYEYELNPSTYFIDNTRQEGERDVSDGLEQRKPKVVLVGAIHGRERTPAFALYELVKAILERENDPLIKFIRESVHLVFNPISNPSGFNANSYGNNKGINLNRHYPPSGDGTEKEVKIVKDMIDRNLDADLFIDLHTKFDFEWDGYLGWSYTENENLKNTINLMFQSIGQEWQAENPALPQDWNYIWSYNAPSIGGTSERYAKLNGIEGTAVLECSWMLDGVDTQRYGKHATRMSKELIVNTISGYLRTKFIE